MNELLRMARGLKEIVKTANEKMLFKKGDFEAAAMKVAPGLEFTGDDWIWKGDETAYPSETASISLTERDDDGNIVKTGIAALYGGFPIVVADETKCYLYEDNRIVPVVSVSMIFVNDPKIPVRCHIFGQKSTPHWTWMNGVIGILNEREIRTDNNMGPYFVLRNFLYYHQEVGKGIVIAPMKAVISEPFSNKPKEEIGAFIINALNQGLPVGEQFTLTDMSGEELFRDGKIEKVESCETSYCAAGWVAGTSEEDVQKTLLAIREAAEANPPPDLPEGDSSRVKIEKLIEDINHLQV